MMKTTPLDVLRENAVGIMVAWAKIPDNQEKDGIKAAVDAYLAACGVNVGRTAGEVIRRRQTAIKELVKPCLLRLSAKEAYQLGNVLFELSEYRD